MCTSHYLVLLHTDVLPEELILAAVVSFAVSVPDAYGVPPAQCKLHVNDSADSNYFNQQ